MQEIRKQIVCSKHVYGLDKIYLLELVKSKQKRKPKKQNVNNKSPLFGHF